MNGLVVLQARTSSSRLPAKVLLPVAGMPLAVLAAKRAANRGHDVVVATSTERSDDYLAATLEAHGIRVFRGSLDDALGRFAGVVEECPDDMPVFRLTADNVVPDGELLVAVEADFRNRKLGYLSCNHKGSGLPYGVSVEITTAGILRSAASKATDPADREHVTPWIIRTHGMADFKPVSTGSMENYRCTIDNLDDYLGVVSLFDGVKDGVNLPMSDVLERMRQSANRPVTSASLQKLVFGTAQLGLRYGIGNITGQPDAATARSMIREAIRNGVEYFDTARAYGDSEKVIGEAMAQGWAARAKIITKLQPMAASPAEHSADSAALFVEASVFQSCHAMKAEKIDTLLLHRAGDRLAQGGGAWARLLKMKQDGLIDRLGVSVQTPGELIEAVADAHVDHIQLPFHLLDWRWDEAIAVIRQVKKQRNLVVHTRSPLLQGLLVSENPDHWRAAGAPDPHLIPEWLRLQAERLERQNVADLCIAYLNSRSWIDGIVVGMETRAQMLENFSLFGRPALTADERQELETNRPKMPEKMLDPSSWSSA
ncbi:MAG: aldo/keto reductase [Pseudomonadota bacterium]